MKYILIILLFIYSPCVLAQITYKGDYSYREYTTPLKEIMALDKRIRNEKEETYWLYFRPISSTKPDLSIKGYELFFDDGTKISTPENQYTATDAKLEPDGNSYQLTYAIIISPININLLKKRFIKGFKIFGMYFDVDSEFAVKFNIEISQVISAR